MRTMPSAILFKPFLSVCLSNASIMSKLMHLSHFLTFWYRHHFSFFNPTAVIKFQ